jgi:hypothetical protein
MRIVEKKYENHELLNLITFEYEFSALRTSTKTTNEKYGKDNST